MQAPGPNNAAQVDSLIARMAEGIIAQQLATPLLIGIHTGGAWLAERLQARIYPTEPPPLGTLDISFYRDDFSRVGLHPEVRASNLPPVDGRDLVLVDDVLHTGRTIRATLNEIFSYGRPRRVCLAVLVQRPGRELPIQADVVGLAWARPSRSQTQPSGWRLGAEHRGPQRRQIRA